MFSPCRFVTALHCPFVSCFVFAPEPWACRGALVVVRGSWCTFGPVLGEEPTQLAHANGAGKQAPTVVQHQELHGAPGMTLPPTSAPSTNATAATGPWRTMSVVDVVQVVRLTEVVVSVVVEAFEQAGHLFKMLALACDPRQCAIYLWW